MKKKSIKSLKLKKQSISNLNARTTNGGIIWSIGCRLLELMVDVGVSVANGLEGDCVESWGDPGCPTGLDGIC